MGWREQLLKNARNYAKYLEKRARGPLKAFFHITKNENVPAIEQQGLLTNHPNANINSANHPFRKHGTDAGGVWVTTEPTAFPVYGTTIGGKNGNVAARADALSTIKIEVPLPELSKMKAVQDPYGKNILRKGDDPRAVEKFGTWAGVDVPTTVLLNDIKPQWLKNIGYLEEAVKPYEYTEPALLQFKGGWDINPKEVAGDASQRRMLNKADLRALSGMTGHHSGNLSLNQYEKNPIRFVDEYIDKNQPITERLPKLPESLIPEDLALVQSKSYEPKYVLDGAVEVLDPIDVKRYSINFDFVPANQWTENYQDYVKPGESIYKQRTRKFAPGAISRGIGGAAMPPIKDRTFDWNTYLKGLQAGMTPKGAASMASPRYYLDWDNIVYNPESSYAPNKIWPEDYSFKFNAGAISRGRPESSVRTIIEGPINIKQLSDVKKASTVVGDAPKKYLIDRLNTTDAAASNELEAISENATWSDIIRAVMKANVNSK